jgi:hypothetical protein
MQFLADQFRKQKTKHPKAADFADYQQLYASQGPKQIYWKQVLKDFRSADWFSTEYS